MDKIPGGTAKQSEPLQEQPASAAELMIHLGPAEWVIVGTFGPLVTAFCTELGRRMGGSAADWISRVRLLRRKDDPTKALLGIKTGRVAIIVELEEDLSDDAKLALIDLNVQNKVFRGRRLRWNKQVREWQPIGRSGLITRLRLASKRAKLEAALPDSGARLDENCSDECTKRTRAISNRLPYVGKSEVGEPLAVPLIPAVETSLRQLQERTNLSRTDLVNRAITSYDFFDANLRAGNELIVRNAKTGETHLIQFM